MIPGTLAELEFTSECKDSIASSIPAFELRCSHILFINYFWISNIGVSRVALPLSIKPRNFRVLAKVASVFSSSKFSGFGGDAFNTRGAAAFQAGANPPFGTFLTRQPIERRYFS